MRLLDFTAVGLIILLVCAMLPSRAAGDESVQGPNSRILSEIRVGVLYHDAGIFATREENGVVDGNIEFLFTSPRFLRFVWSPRPHLGVTANFQGDTSKAYLGLTWNVDLFSDTFFEFGVGGAVHNGELDTQDPYMKNLGCRLLFRLSASLGYRITEHTSISAMIDHMSNAQLCEQNDGLDTVGIRLGYRF